MKKSTIRLILALSACGILAGGCAGARPIETQKAGTISGVTTVQAFQDKGNNGVPDSITSRFQVLLDEALYADNIFNAVLSLRFDGKSRPWTKETARRDISPGSLEQAKAR